MKKISIQRNKLYLENNKIIFLTKDMINKFSLAQKTEISDEDLEKLIKMRLRISAFNMLSKKDYFSKELYEKLIEKIGFERYAAELINELIDCGYLNDIEKAKEYMETHKNYGNKKLAFIFSKMGLKNYEIQEIIEENEDVEIENIVNLWKSMRDREAQKKISSLLNKGFSYASIKKAIQDMEENE